jgi:hypothetical protein
MPALTLRNLYAEFEFTDSPVELRLFRAARSGFWVETAFCVRFVRASLRMSSQVDDVMCRYKQRRWRDSMDARRSTCG